MPIGWIVGASLLARGVNDDAGSLVSCGVLGFFASELAPTVGVGGRNCYWVILLRAVVNYVFW